MWGIWANKSISYSRCDRYSQAGIRRIQQVEWLKYFRKIRSKAFTTSDIKAGWKEAGLVPFYPRKVLDSLPFVAAQLLPTSQTSSTSPNSDLSVPTSSPPDGTAMASRSGL
ncbi:hypothetical protein BJ878DRAFT_512792 [Calycina marina]|uniref:Uncharacterized protein n=1 Tax=Calycina marina TaxID=1763456 RepID=A0A9P7Z0A5_9HELO|nr:hypothetical protein BJ878DRAFT_512792 [Calycina marina]